MLLRPPATCSYTGVRSIPVMFIATPRRTALMRRWGWDPHARLPGSGKQPV